MSTHFFLSLLWLIPAIPLAGFVVLSLFGAMFGKKTCALLGAGSVGLSAIMSVFVASEYAAQSAPFFRITLWQWMRVGRFAPGITLYIDSLSLVFVCVVTVVGFLIHLYSTAFMASDESYSRFFAYMNLFVAAMLTLVLADNLVLLLLGWEGVGLCSYLLIGFWYRNAANGRAARKAFIVTRVGDTAMEIGLFLLFSRLGTLGIQDLAQAAQQQFSENDPTAIAACLLLLGGAIGKSGQVPLQVWLPDAMAGPTPVSALIHAATMVTAGVYLIARMHGLFTLAPAVMTVVAAVGAVTLVMAAGTALVTRDLKRVLAYSTISQVGYMFLGLGVGAWAAAVFHFVTHAFFKSLLFLSSGVIIESLHEEHDILKMGGLKKSLPVVFWTFLVGAASLSALPLVTAGYYSKELLLEEVWSARGFTSVLLLFGLLGSFLTALYAFRLVFLVFFGNQIHQTHEDKSLRIRIPLYVLAVGSLAAGFTGVSGVFGSDRSLITFLQESIPAFVAGEAEGGWLRQLLLTSLPIAGLLGAYTIYYVRPAAIHEHLADGRGLVPLSFARRLHSFLFNGWGFDWLYERAFVRPFVDFASVGKNDFVNSLYDGLAEVNVRLHEALRATQSGLARAYIMSIVIGGVIFVWMMVTL